MQFQPFRMEYLRGDRMFVDALSRPPPSTVNAISLKDIEHTQPLDPYLQSLRKAKRSPSPLIFRNNAFFHLDGRLFVPLAKREEVLISCHDQAGHFGLQHTLSALRKTFYWPGLYTDTENFVASCNKCQKAKPARPRTKLPLRTLDPPAVVFGDRLHLDLVDMPRSSAGHVAICTIVDAATGFVIVHPCLDKTHKGVIETLRTRVFPNFGCPKLLVTDKGKENVNDKVKRFLDNFHILHVCLLYTSPSPRD